MGFVGNVTLPANEEDINKHLRVMSLNLGNLMIQVEILLALGSSIFVARSID